MIVFRPFLAALFPRDAPLARLVGPRSARTQPPYPACGLVVVAVNAAGGVDRPDAGAGVTGCEPERGETRDDCFTEHDRFLQ